MEAQDRGKKAAGEQAVVDLVRPGMKLGLGTGSTAFWAIAKTGELYRSGQLPGLVVVPTSFDTEIQCQNEGLQVRTLASPEVGGQLDLYLDGADEFAPNLDCIKGGGAAQLQEKIVCDASKVFVIIADESKAVAHLGTKFPVPVEIAALARVPLTLRLQQLGAKVALRYGKGKAGPVVTDNGNLIFDLTFEKPVDCAAMESKIQTLTGVIEVGLFAGRAQKAYVGRADGSCDVRTPQR
jgi:ribose 5-phosphate isomerase A